MAPCAEVIHFTDRRCNPLDICLRFSSRNFFDWSARWVRQKPADNTQKLAALPTRAHVPSPISEKQWPNCQSDKHESEWRQQSSKRIIKNAKSGAESYDKSHDEPKKTPLPAPAVAQNAVLDPFQ